MKKTRQKLALKTETVRLLSDRGLRDVRGGGWYTGCVTSEVNGTCSDPTTGSERGCHITDTCYTAGCM
jgi:hypothetical protein